MADDLNFSGKSSPKLDETMTFRVRGEEELHPGDVLKTVYAALREKGYNPINQLVGYLISGDPAYITSHKQARSLIRRVERDDLIEELVSAYLRDIR
ncbi:MAG: IreB family regulatory phosphoprotein [Firmicutes bacterium]|nr:IreB family regulatory phosphoprotein [Bacillota bacterium]